MPPCLLSLHFPASLLPLIFLQLTSSCLPVSSKAQTYNITTCSISSLLRSLQQPKKTLPECSVFTAWVLSPGCSLVREGERTWFGEIHWHMHENSHGKLANERLRQMHVLHLGRLNTIRPPHCLLYKAKYCNSKSGHEVVPQQGGWQGTRSSVDAGSKRRENIVPWERPWQQEDQKKKKPGTDLGTDCVIKWSRR